MFFLQPHNSNLEAGDGPRAQIREEGDRVVVSFEYKLPGEPYVNNKLQEDYKNWGLWETDVFEAFLTRADSSLPYLELQVSPLNQKFALNITEPRKDTSYPEEAPFISHTFLVSGVWKSEMIIPLDKIPGNSKVLRGNLHAIIGAERKHFSVNPNPEPQPDFHRPELFGELLELKGFMEAQ